MKLGRSKKQAAEQPAAAPMATASGAEKIYQQALARLDERAQPLLAWRDELAALEAELPQLDAQRIDLLTLAQADQAEQLELQVERKTKRAADLRRMCALRIEQLRDDVAAMWDGERAAWLEAVKSAALADFRAKRAAFDVLLPQVRQAEAEARVANMVYDNAAMAAAENSWGSVRTNGIDAQMAQLLGAPADVAAVDEARSPAELEAALAKRDEAVRAQFTPPIAPAPRVALAPNAAPLVGTPGELTEIRARMRQEGLQALAASHVDGPEQPFELDGADA